MEALKHDLGLAMARAEAAEAEKTEHLNIARGQVQVLTLGLASIGCKLRDVEFERQRIEAELKDAEGDMEELRLAKQESTASLRTEVEEELAEAALRLQASDAAQEGLKEDLQASESRISHLEASEESLQAALARAEELHAEAAARHEVEKTTVSQELGGCKAELATERAKSAAVEAAREEATEERLQGVQGELQSWREKGAVWERERGDLAAQVKAQQEELEFAKKCLFSKNALRPGR